GSLPGGSDGGERRSEICCRWCDYGAWSGPDFWPEIMTFKTCHAALDGVHPVRPGQQNSVT
ncbi:hypothetical protein, partial [Acinetobacter baumannii]|uniref:hypothetical protein n=1 Tax=Acinetobacter baumannii TaxID=470 RepID=UPI001C081AAA